MSSYNIKIKDSCTCSLRVHVTEQEEISMKQIKIGTCVPGPVAEEWLKGFVGKGFETFSLNFHMSLEGTDLDKLALTTDKLLAGTDSKITTLGYYCNRSSMQNTERHWKR